MSDILFPVSGGGGGNLDEITASAEHVKSPYTFMNSEGDIEEGTMVNRENWGASVGMNDRVTVPEGYHDGSGGGLRPYSDPTRSMDIQAGG